MLLEQCLPFTVLKLDQISLVDTRMLYVGTVLTVYGIETQFFVGPSSKN